MYNWLFYSTMLLIEFGAPQRICPMYNTIFKVYKLYILYRVNKTTKRWCQKI